MDMIATKPKPAANNAAVWDSYTRMTRNDAAERPNMIKDIANIVLIFNLQTL